MRHTSVWSLLVTFLLVVPAVKALPFYPDHQRQPEDMRMDGQGKAFWFGYPGNASRIARTILITATEFRFSPATVNVKVGETVRFTIVNRGKIAHEFVIGDTAEQIAHDKEMAAMSDMTMDDANGVSVAAGKTASLVWTFTRPGQLQYACHTPGHYAAGMSGTLIVHG